ncbi:prepilin-type N-terminal cleavage/methylation domain-containing protein [Campylobacter concisus]|uniref:Prepilin-type cleavage/methylation domain-containing protein n=1 Tax=Campylobacter concisus TaxID=199 RepID=A0A1Y5MKH6_9BACT|nr:type II secretion system protein [Campylobacter concisus]MBS5827676.1 type II secretion system protein [Campylobacter concisus]OUT09101.1 prepilin-type cleavage/methylation domain-containing protein [Campylobacter concisus]
MVKRGFSLIELILSIVVVAIISTSIPLVLKTTSELNQKAVTQESLMNAKTYMGLILKAPFSDKVIKVSTNIGGSSAETAYFFPIILKPGDQRNEFYKINKITGDGHRVFAYTNSSDLVPDTAVRSVDYYKTRNKNLNTTNQNRDYIVGSDYEVSVSEGKGWFKPNLGLDNSDVKEISVTATSYKNDTKQETTSVLRAYAFNLGEGGSLNTKAWK